MMNLPFLKKRRTPRQQPPTEDKSVGLSPDEELEDHCISELMDACENKDPKAFRSSLEALVMNIFIMETMMEADCYAEGGEADGDHEAMMDQCASECMSAIESKDKEAFRESFEVLVADILNKMKSSDGEE